MRLPHAWAVDDLWDLEKEKSDLFIQEKMTTLTEQTLLHTNLLSICHLIMLFT